MNLKYHRQQAEVDKKTFKRYNKNDVYEKYHQERKVETDKI